MTRFKKGDKVVLSKTAFRENEGSLWMSEVCEFLGKNKFLTVESTSPSCSHCNIEEFPQYIFKESWLEPYTENIPKVLSTSIYDCNPIIPLPEDGPTMRDEFAMAALKGLLSSGKDCVVTEPSSLARVVYGIADAMMEVRHGNTVQQ